LAKIRKSPNISNPNPNISMLLGQNEVIFALKSPKKKKKSGKKNILGLEQGWVG
jgi:hypothetical protein